MEEKKMPFEEALSMTGFGRYNMMVLALSTNIMMAMAVEASSVAYLVPASACELQTTPEQQGLMAGMPLVGILAASNVWGYYADTRGRRKVLIVAMIMSFVAGCAATISPNWIVFCFLKFLSSTAMAGIYGLCSALIAECTPVSRRSLFLMMMTSVFASSVGCMAALTIPVLPLKFSYHIPYLDIQFNSWRLLNIIYSLPSATGAIGTYFAFESPKFLLNMGKDKEALDILRKMYVINNGKDGSFYKVQAVYLDEERAAASEEGFWRSIINQVVPLFQGKLLKNTLLLSAIFITIYFSVNPFTVWLPFMFDAFMKSLRKGEAGLTFCQMLRSSQNDTSTVEDVKLNDCTFDPTAMLVVLGMYFITAIMNMVMSSLLNCVSRKSMLIGIQMVTGTSVLLVNSSTVWILTAVLLLIFMHGMLNFGVANTFSVGMFPTYVKAMGVCLTLMVGRGSAVLGINLLKSLLTYHCESTFYIFGSITIFGGLLGFLLPNEEKSSETMDTEDPAPSPKPKQIST